MRRRPLQPRRMHSDGPAPLPGPSSHSYLGAHPLISQQTYLAIYFVFVDVSLVVQYFYYSRRPTPHSHAVSRARRTSVDRVRYRTLSVVAANVAASAAFAAQQDEHAHVDHRRRCYNNNNNGGDDDDDDENALAALADSFHSEAGHEARRKNISWSIERYRQRSGSLGGVFPASARSSSEDILHSTARRGRPLEREVHVGGGVGLEIEAEVASPSRLHSKASRRSAGTMMFLGAWALFGMGAFAHQRRVGSTRTGVVVSSRGLHDMTESLGERVIGRIFAWLCTTLYLTSRLPQIWKNSATGTVDVSVCVCLFGKLVLRGVDLDSARNGRADEREHTVGCERVSDVQVLTGMQVSAGERGDTDV
ncbi:hypothetical protein C0995_003767 [Termitomyces sp. Mi166|nr:hypothetical protein C0995_003767 [Termitomyces sp. Mi166\